MRLRSSDDELELAAILAAAGAELTKRQHNTLANIENIAYLVEHQGFVPEPALLLEACNNQKSWNSSSSHSFDKLLEKAEKNERFSELLDVIPSATLTSYLSYNLFKHEYKDIRNMECGRALKLLAQKPDYHDRLTPEIIGGLTKIETGNFVFLPTFIDFVESIADKPDLLKAVNGMAGAIYIRDHIEHMSSKAPRLMELFEPLGTLPEPPANIVSYGIKRAWANYDHNSEHHADKRDILLFVRKHLPNYIASEPVRQAISDRVMETFSRQNGLRHISYDIWGRISDLPEVAEAVKEGVRRGLTNLASNNPQKIIAMREEINDIPLGKETFAQIYDEFDSSSLERAIDAGFDTNLQQLVVRKDAYTLRQILAQNSGDAELMKKIPAVAVEIIFAEAKQRSSIASMKEELAFTLGYIENQPHLLDAVTVTDARKLMEALSDDINGDHGSQHFSVAVAALSKHSRSAAILDQAMLEDTIARSKYPASLLIGIGQGVRAHEQLGQYFRDGIKSGRLLKLEMA